MFRLHYYISDVLVFSYVPATIWPEETVTEISKLHIFCSWSMNDWMQKIVCIVSFWVGVSEVASRVPRPARLRWQMVEDYRPRSRGAVMNRSPQPVHHCGARLRANTCLNRKMCLTLNIAIIEIEMQCFAEASWWSSWSGSESKEGEILSCLQSPQVCDPPQACPACPL